MNFQTIIVGIILLGAFVYVGKQAWRKAGSFSAKKSDCGGNCGCDAKRNS